MLGTVDPPGPEAPMKELQDFLTQMRAYPKNDRQAQSAIESTLFTIQMKKRLDKITERRQREQQTGSPHKSAQP